MNHLWRKNRKKSKYFSSKNEANCVKCCVMVDRAFYKGVNSMWIDQWMRNKTAIHVCLSTITNKLFYTLGIFLFRSKRKRISEKCRKRRENQPIEIIVLNFTTTIGLYNLNQSYTQSIEITRWFLGSSILAALFSLALHRSPSLSISLFLFSYVDQHFQWL